MDMLREGAGILGRGEISVPRPFLYGRIGSAMADTLAAGMPHARVNDSVPTLCLAYALCMRCAYVVHRRIRRKPLTPKPST